MTFSHSSLASGPVILSEFSNLLPDITVSREDRRPSNPYKKQPLGVALIGTTELFGEVLITALTAAEPATRFSLHPSLDEWFASPAHVHDRVLMLYFSNYEPALFDESLFLGIEKLKFLDPQPRFVVCASQVHYSQILKALEIGAHGYIVPSMSLNVVLQVIHLVDAGGVFVPASSFKDLPEVSRSAVESKAPDINGLSPRQVLVAKALRKGTPNKVIAYELNMCESTVKVHVRHIMKKLNAKNRTQIAFLTNSMFSEHKD